jgi:hypothetical protein
MELSSQAYEENTEVLELPPGDLYKIANNNDAAAAIGIISVIWLLWTVASMFIPW